MVEPQPAAQSAYLSNPAQLLHTPYQSCLLFEPQPRPLHIYPPLHISSLLTHSSGVSDIAWDKASDTGTDTTSDTETDLDTDTTEYT